MSRGNALIEVLVIGFGAALVVLQVTSTAAKLQAAGDEVTEVAQSAASFAARYGDAQLAEAVAIELLPNARVAVIAESGQLTVRIHTDVPLVGPSGSPISMTVTGEASARISAFRSGYG